MNLDDRPIHRFMAARRARWAREEIARLHTQLADQERRLAAAQTILDGEEA